ncbi:MAG: tetratricopeptide repeat protein [bacterium]
MNTRKQISFIIFAIIPTYYSLLYALAGERERLEKAHQFFQTGNYEKALIEFEKAAQEKKLAVEAYLGLGRVFVQTGEYAKAEEIFQRALSLSPENPEALSLLGDLFARIGRYEEARSNFEKALELDPNHLLSRLKLGIMQWEWGEKRLARQTLQYFVSYYQSRPGLSAHELNLIARACIYLDRFRDANDLFHEATKSDQSLWQAYIPWGNLFLSKYNIPDARSVFEDALAINPNAAEAHLGLAKCFRSSNFEEATKAAEQALAINPNLIEAHNFLAELDIAVADYEAALEKLEASLQINPNSLTSRTLRAVCFFFLRDDKKFKGEEEKILSINPKYGDLYFQIAEVLSKRYLFKESVEYYKKALELDPEHWAARAGLGTSLSRLGKEEQAKIELEAAFARDPYNKYVGNLLTLFDSFPRYKTHSSERFILRMHEKDDAILSKYAAELVEESLSYLGSKYPVDWSEPVVVEIFPEHDDFAVRCFGLPGAQAFLGICFGNVVAMDSPSARTKGDFTWGETLWHELVHVTHLRLTENRIPRWLAEGIAVYETATARPYWYMNLDLPFITAFRNNYLLPLKELDAGFNRPRSPGQVSLSYFQAFTVVEFIAEKYGREKLLDTFPEFKSGKETAEVIQAVFGKTIDVLDGEFKNYVREKYKLEDVDYAYDSREAAAHAEAPGYLSKKIVESPNNPFLNLQFGLYYKKKGEPDKAIPYLEKTKKLFPRFVQHNNPYEILAEIYLEQGLKEKAIEELKSYTSLNGKDLKALTMLSDLCMETKDYDCAVEALTKAVYISPFDSGVHKKRGSAYLAQNRIEEAIQEFQILLHTHPSDLAGAHCDLAYAYLQAGKKSEAKKSALNALEIAPNYERAQEILLACVE